ncbi:hypothetical protein [Stenotrophomonas sp. MMGLT7]|uniref:hypothetical protein n=1 Tax=Stenotrophomonas sp. MMGLT7 TaxID=2901227 RepID=UPI001E57949B|nr:hypothetical protein [Stenotrophomonas sp. MMGLT7]MCD7096912.1 hypothetical protein [Stenotrophomonas sp. MMGLT7]
MRDMLARKFEQCARHAGFHPVPAAGLYVSDDGLRVWPVLKGDHFNGTVAVNRRATLQRLLAVRRAHTEKLAAGDGPANEDRAAPASGPLRQDEEATGAGTPMASG